MAETEFVEIKHSKVEGTYMAPVSALEHYEANGWTRVTKTEQRQAEQSQKKSEG